MLIDQSYHVADFPYSVVQLRTVVYHVSVLSPFAKTRSVQRPGPPFFVSSKHCVQLLDVCFRGGYVIINNQNHTTH